MRRVSCWPARLLVGARQRTAGGDQHQMDPVTSGEIQTLLDSQTLLRDAQDIQTRLDLSQYMVTLGPRFERWSKKKAAQVPTYLVYLAKALYLVKLL